MTSSIIRVSTEPGAIAFTQMVSATRPSSSEEITLP